MKNSILPTNQQNKIVHSQILTFKTFKQNNNNKAQKENKETLSMNKIIYNKIIYKKNRKIKEIKKITLKFYTVLGEVIDRISSNFSSILNIILKMCMCQDRNIQLQVKIKYLLKLLLLPNMGLQGQFLEENIYSNISDGLYLNGLERYKKRNGPI